jgi:hypothetical protein
MMTIALLAAGYLAFLTFILALLTMAKRGDQAASRQYSTLPAPTARALPGHQPLAHVATAVHERLGAERITVVVSDPDDPASGTVCATLGAPELLGSRVPVEKAVSVGLLQSPQAEALGLAVAPDPDDSPWAFAHVPLTGTAAVAGAVTVAARRAVAFGEHDIDAIERLARDGARHFDRRRRPRATA